MTERHEAGARDGGYGHSPKLDYENFRKMRQYIPADNLKPVARKYGERHAKDTFNSLLARKEFEEEAEKLNGKSLKENYAKLADLTYKAALRHVMKLRDITEEVENEQVRQSVEDYINNITLNTEEIKEQLEPLYGKDAILSHAMVESLAETFVRKINGVNAQHMRSGFRAPGNTIGDVVAAISEIATNAGVYNDSFKAQLAHTASKGDIDQLIDFYGQIALRQLTPGVANSLEQLVEKAMHGGKDAGDAQPPAGGHGGHPPAH